MDLASLETSGSSPLVLGVTLVVSLLVGAALLIWVLRWTEGFVISFWASLKMTALAIVAATVCEVAIFAAILHLGYTSMSAYWLGLGITTVIAVIVSIAIYAYGVKRPSGEQIGLARAIKVTLMQLALSVAVIVVLAIVIAVLIVSGAIDLPEVPGLEVP